VLITVVLILVLVVGLQTLTRWAARRSTRPQTPSASSVVAPPEPVTQPMDSAPATSSPSQTPIEPSAADSLDPAASTETPIPSQTTQPSAPVQGRIPAAFNGTWKGTVFEQNATPRAYEMSLTLHAGSAKGTIRLAGLRCAGILNVALPEPTDTTLNLYLSSMRGPTGHCAGQTEVAVTLVSQRLITVDFKDATQQETRATLTRS